MMKPNAIAVHKYLVEHNGENVTAADIAEALGLTTKQVDGIVTAGFQRKNLSVRTPQEVEYEEVDKEGNTVTKVKTVKFISLTEAGLAFDPESDDNKVTE